LDFTWRAATKYHGRVTRFLRRKIAWAMALFVASFVLSSFANEKVAQTVVRITTDSQGRVIRVIFLKPLDPALEKHCREFALARWKGPPNSTRDVPLTFTLDPSKKPDTSK
jgi:hypothetical protein